MGKISLTSIAFLQKEEISFLKACAGRNVSVLRYFIKNGVNVNLLDEDRTSPLHIACRSGSLQVVEELINLGGTINMADMAGWTPLHVAAYHQRPLICHLLLKNGADPYLTSRQGETPWDFVKDRNTEEIFFIHFDRTELRQMSRTKKEHAPGEIVDEYVSVSQHKPKENTFQTKHDLETREFSPDKMRNFSPECTKNFRKTVLNSVSTNIQRDNSRNYGEMTSPADINIFQKTTNLTDKEDFDIEKRPKNGSLFPKKHKYYIYFKKMKALHTSSLQGYREVLYTLNTEGSDDEGYSVSEYISHDLGHSPTHQKRNSQAIEFGFDGLQPSNSNSNMLDNPLTTKRMNSLNVPKNLKSLSPERKLSRGILPANASKTHQQLGHQSNQNLLSHQNSANTSFAIASSLSRMDKSNTSCIPLLTANISIYKLFYKDPREIMFTNLDIEGLHIGSDQRNLVDLSSFKITEKDNELLYKLGVELFNYDGLMGIAFLMLFKFIRISIKDIAFFLYSDEGRMSAKKNLYEITNLFTNVQIKECLQLQQTYAGFFHFENMTFIEALRLYLSSFVIENDPEKIDWLLRGFSRQYFKTIKRMERNSLSVPNKQKFETIEAIRMLAFTVVMLDIELHHSDPIDDEDYIDYTQIRKELHSNLAGINDGENFSQVFINDIFEEVKKERLIRHIGYEGAHNKAKLFFKSAKLSIKACRQSRKNKEIQKEYILYFAGPVCFMVKTQKDKSIPKGLFMINCSEMKVISKNEVQFVPKSHTSTTLMYTRFKNNGNTMFSTKQKINLNVGSEVDIGRIEKYISSL